MALFLQYTEIETDFHNCGEELFHSVLDEVPFPFHQNQETVVIQLSHPCGVKVSVLDIIGSISRDILSPDIEC
jgi:hypothetical protein